MIDSSASYKAAITGDVRRMYVRAIIDLIDPDIAYGSNTSSGEATVSDGLVHDKVFTQGRAYATCEPGRVTLNGKMHVYPDSGSAYSNGFLSDELSGVDGTTNQWVQINFSNVSTLQACSVYFPDNDYDGVAEDFTVSVYSGGTAYYTKSITGNTSPTVSFDGFTVSDPTAIRVTVTKWSLPYRLMRVVEIVPGIYEQWGSDVIAEIKVNQKIDPSCLSLPYGTCSIKIDNQSRRFEPRNKSGLFKSIEERQGIPVGVGALLEDGSKEYKQVGVFYQHSGGWETGENGITIQWYLVDIIGLIANRTYIAPATLPTTLSTWAASLVAQLGVNFETRYSVDSNYASTALTCSATAISGKTCGDILRWICQASGTFPRTDAETGYLCIEPVWRAGRNITLDNMSVYPVIKANSDISSIIITLANGTQLTYSGNKAAADTVSISNPFITTSTTAAELARRVLSFYGGNQIEITDRGDPSAELGDVDRVQLDKSTATNARRIVQEIGFSDGVMRSLASTLIQANGRDLYEKYTIVTASGTITLPSVTRVHLILVGAGCDGTDGAAGDYSAAGENGVDGAGGRIWASDIDINSGASATVTIGAGAGAATTLVIGGATYSSADGSLYNGFSDLLTGNVYGRDGVEVPRANSGDGGKGGIGGCQGNKHIETVIASQHWGSSGYYTTTEDITVIDNYPGDGTAGADGASGCVIIWYEG